MRNLILFLTRNYYILLFFLLETVAITLVMQNNHFQRSHFLNSSNALAGEIYSTWDGITDYFGLRRENEILSKELARARNELRYYTSGRPFTVSGAGHPLQYRYLSAKVVNNSTNRQKNYLTLNAGSLQGVKKGSAVIGPEGVVGIVRDVSDNFSSVMSVLHENARISVTIKRFGENNIMTWDGKDERFAQVARIPSHLNLKKGDTLVTSSYSDIFPEGIAVGFIETYEKISGNTFNDATIRLSTDFSRLRYVHVVVNFMKEEQKNLESKQTQ